MTCAAALLVVERYIQEAHHGSLRCTTVAQGLNAYRADLSCLQLSTFRLTTAKFATPRLAATKVSPYDKHHLQALLKGLFKHRLHGL